MWVGLKKWWKKPATDVDELVEAAKAAGAKAERLACAAICDELERHWNDYKDAALLNGDVKLSNAASGEPRAARAIKDAILARSNDGGQGREASPGPEC